MNFWIRFTLAVLVTWRVTHLLANEDGPADLIARFRARLGDRFFGKLMDCFKCLSLWVALPVAFFVTWQPIELLFTWLALSGAACLLQRIGQEPVIIQPISEIEEEKDNGMLRSETREYEEHFVTGESHIRDAPDSTSTRPQG